MNVQKQKGQNVDAATAQKAVDILKVSPVQCFHFLEQIVASYSLMLVVPVRPFFLKSCLDVLSISIVKANGKDVRFLLGMLPWTILLIVIPLFT